jgi:hypothetical protein
MNKTPPQGDPADRTAYAKRLLFGRILAAIPPGRRGQAEDWLTDLLYLAESSLSGDARAEVIRETLGEAGPEPAAEQDFEVSGEIWAARARSPQEAVAMVLHEMAQELEDRHATPDPNPRFYVRPAHSRGQGQLVYEHDAPELPQDAGQGCPVPGIRGR